MKNFLVLCSVMVCAGFVHAGKIDVAKSKVTWTGTKIVGEKHTGEVKIKSADLKYVKGEPVSGKIVIDMTSITVTDIKNAKYNKKFVDHMHSDDFFSTKKYKTATLDISKIQKASDKFYFVHGKMTIKGQSEDVKLKANVTKDTDAQQTIAVDFDFDRTKFGVKYGSGSFFDNLGDKMISDTVNLQIIIHINKDKSLAAI